MVISKHCCYSCFFVVVAAVTARIFFHEIKVNERSQFREKKTITSEFHGQNSSEKITLIMILYTLSATSEECVPVEQLLKRNTVAF